MRRTLGKEEKRAAAPLAPSCCACATRHSRTDKGAPSLCFSPRQRRSPPAISLQLLFLDLKVQPGVDKQPRGRVPLLDQCYPLMFSALCSCTLVHRLTSDGVTGRAIPALQHRGPDAADAGWTPSFSPTRRRTVPGEGEKDESDYLIWCRDGRNGEAPFQQDRKSVV